MAQTRALTKFWIATSDQIDRVLAQEKFMQLVEPTKEVLVVHRLVSDMYCRYVQLCRSLDRCFDQTLQVQKREVIQCLLEAANARMLELGSKLKELELSEFVYVDGALQALHLIPDDVKAVKPCYFPAKRPLDLQMLIDSRTLEKFASEDSDEEDSSSNDSDQEAEKSSTAAETRKRPKAGANQREKRTRAALTLITAHEKARQARVRQTNFQLHPDRYYPKPIDEDIEDVKYEFFFRPGQVMLFPVKRTVYNWNFHMKKKNVIDFAYYAPLGYEGQVPIVSESVQMVTKLKQIPQEDHPVALEEAEERRKLTRKFKRLNHAAVIIQRCWHRYRDMKTQKRLRDERSRFLGLFDDYKPIQKHFNTVEGACAARREMKPEFDIKFLEAIADEKARILRTRGPALLEDIGDVVRAWFRQWYDEAHAFDVIPEPFLGGTILIVRGETLTPQEYLEHQRRKQLEKLKSAEQKKKEAEAKMASKELEQSKKRGDRDRLKTLAREKRDREKKEGKTYDFTEPEFDSNAYVSLNETIRRYRKDWAFIDELENTHEDMPIMEWVRMEIFAEVHQELHSEVHELLKSERELLQMALCKDERRKYKSPMLKKLRRVKGKGKARTKEKWKEPIDVLADRSPESMIDELVERKIIKSFRKRTFEEFVGDFNYAAFEWRNRLKQDPPPGMGEVRTILRSYLFGMGPLLVSKPKSICLVGPPGYGKTLLLEAICHETGSVLFDLGVETCGPVPASDIPVFLQLILRVARRFQPSVIAIEDVHRAFYKKVPSDEEPFDPGKLGKHLFKQIAKQLKQDDKVLLVATTGQPWLAKLGPLKKCFETFLLLPQLDYGSTVLLWQHALGRFVSIPRDIDLSALATVTKGYSPRQILRCAKEVLSIRRRMQFGRRPLKVAELLDHLLEQLGQHPLTDKEYEKYVKWYRKVDKFAKTRAKLMRERQLLANQKKAKANGAKK